MEIVIGAIGVVLTAIGVYLAYKQLKSRPPVVEEKKEPEPTRPIPQPPRRPEPRFIDRHDREGRDLVERASEALGGNGLVTVWGSGGVGKTTLAIEVAHRLCPKPYSGGVIWDTADGGADFTLVTLLDKILTDLEREEARTLAPEAKADLADRLLTEAMPCLLGLDNFETIAEEEQRAIIAFLDKLSCPVLVTSRESLPIGQSIHVGPMRPDEAKQFLTYLVQQSPKRERLASIDLDHLAHEAGYNPMLMRWMIRQLAHEVPAEDVYAGLDRGEGDAERVFKRSFDLLGEDGQTALLALALFAPTASREALAAVCGFEDGKDRVNEAIRRLAAFDLLDTAVEGDRLGIVALTRRLTEAQLKRDERTEGLKKRFVSYFLDYAKTYPEVTKEDLDALDEERENLLVALDYAYVTEDWQSVMSITSTIAFGSLLDIRGYWDQAMKWGERAADAARTAQDEKALAGFAHNTAVIYQKRGRYDEARDLYNQSLQTFKDLGVKSEQTAVLHQLGTLAEVQGDYQEARDLYNQTLEIERELGNQADVASALSQLGILAHRQGDYDQARDLQNQSLNIRKVLDHKEGIAICLHQLGMIAQDRGDYYEAKDLYDQSLQTFRDLGAKTGQAAVLHQLGIIAQLQGHYQEAKDLYNQSLEIKEQLGYQAGIAVSLHQLGIIAQLQGDYQKAKDLYNQSLEIKRDLGDQAGIASSLGRLGSLSEERGNMEEAARLYREALAIFEKLGSPDAKEARRHLARVTGEKPKE
jgi:tetratricopeptide (TPR) repeat protein